MSDVLQSSVRSACTHVFICGQYVSLVKICDPETYDMVLKVTARLMIQINIPEHYLSPVQDPHPKTTAEERLAWLKKGLLPQVACLTREPRFRPTRLLTAAIWL